jgi:hypothetical protein
VEEVRKKCEVLKPPKEIAALARLWTAHDEESFSVRIGYSF